MWVGLGVKYYQGNYGSVIWRCILSDGVLCGYENFFCQISEIMKN